MKGSSVSPLDGQRRIVAYLDGLSERVNELRRLQAESQAELDALPLIGRFAMPSPYENALQSEDEPGFV